MWRGIVGNPQFRGKDDEYAAMWLVLRAAWKPVTIRVGRDAVSLSRGECAYALSFLAKAWECSKTKAHVTLKHLEKAGFVRTQSERGYTRIKVVKYDTYQIPVNADGTPDGTPDGTTTERGRNADGTNKKEVNTLNTLEEEYRGPSLKPPIDEAVEAWNALADDIGLPKVQKLTDARRSRLKARLSDCGGLEGWDVALSKIRASSFLSKPSRGKHPNWRPDFDFILTQSKFTKLMEGGYDDPASNPPNPDNGGIDPIDEAILRAAGLLDAGNADPAGRGYEGEPQSGSFDLRRSA